MPIFARALPLTVPILCGLACTLPPLRGEMEIGRDAYAVFVGEGSGGADLYAVRPGGGVTIALTFSPVAESSPALSPDGASLAFVRTAVNAPATAWVMKARMAREASASTARNFRRHPSSIAGGSPIGNR